MSILTSKNTQTFFPWLDGLRFSVQKGTCHQGIQPWLISLGDDCTLYEIFLKNMLCVCIVQHSVALYHWKCAVSCDKDLGLVFQGYPPQDPPLPNLHTWLISVHFKYKHDCSSEVLLWALGVSQLWQGWFSSMSLRRWTPAEAGKSPQTSHKGGGRPYNADLKSFLSHSRTASGRTRGFTSGL